MIIRILSGFSWTSSSHLGDFDFDVLPSVGHKITLAGKGSWDCGVVTDIVHRIVDEGQAADIAILLGPRTSGGDAKDPLPFEQLDQLGMKKAGGPWS
jgi:hypothetical protein